MIHRISRTCAVFAGLALVAGCGRDGGSPAPDASPTTTAPATSTTTSAPPAPSGGTIPGGAASGVQEEGDRGSFFLRVADQRSDGRTVTVEEAVLTGTSGWLVAHASDGGAPGPVLGVSALLQPGTSKGVTITLDRPIVASKAVVLLMVHRETTGNSTFDFPRGDGPANTADGGIVVVPVDLRIE